MEFVNIGTTGIRVSRIGLGTWAIGGWMWGGTDEPQALRAIHAALERGINLIDTAPVYGFGLSEELVGKALAQVGRHKAVVATKAGVEWRDRKVFRNASKQRLRKEVEDSLRRMKIERIDIYQLHWPDPLVPIEESAAVMKALLEEGKIRAIGVSNFTVEQLEAFAKVAPLHTAQPPYNLFERGIEQDVLPWCRKRGVGSLFYGALCRGLLSGRMRPDSAFQGDDLRRVDPKFKPPRYARYLEAVGRLDRLAQERYGKRVIHLAIRWLIDQPGTNVALWGARKPEQLDAVDAAMGWKVDDSSFREIDKILRETITDPVGPEFMAPPARKG